MMTIETQRHLSVSSRPGLRFAIHECHLLTGSCQTTQNQVMKQSRCPRFAARSQVVTQTYMCASILCEETHMPSASKGGRCVQEGQHCPTLEILSPVWEARVAHRV